jgi:hypothetical protein
MEESSAWRHPIDLIEILDQAFEALPEIFGTRQSGDWTGEESLVQVLLGDDPQAIVDGLLDALRAGADPVTVAGTVAYAAALRIARFHTSNEFGDWDTALHTFTFANAVQQGLRRVGPIGGDNHLLVRGIFDAAMSVYLDRFLNIPAARLPEPNGHSNNGAANLSGLTDLLNHQQQVDEAGEFAARYLYGAGEPLALLASLGGLLLREDRNFHTIQTIEAAFRQYGDRREMPTGTNVLVAAARYLAAHAPTMRAQGQTFQIAHRLCRGERLFEDV